MLTWEKFTRKEVVDLAKAITSLNGDLIRFGAENAAHVLKYAKTHRGQPAHPNHRTDLLYPATPVMRSPPYQLIRV